MIKHFSLLFLLSPCIIGAMDHSSAVYTTSDDKQLFSVISVNDKIFIAGTDGIHIYNNTTKAISTLSEEPTFQIALHPKATHIAISSQAELAVYDTDTEKKNWSKQQPFSLWKITPIIFSSTDNALCTYQAGVFTFHSPHQNIPLKQWKVPLQKAASCIHIASHPTKKEILYPSKENALSIIQIEEGENSTEAIISPHNKYIFNAVYNHNATFIAMIDTHGNCCLYNTTTQSIEPLHYKSDALALHNYISLAFHPHQTILALLTDNSTVHYWNYATQKIIAITKSYLHKDTSESLYFSRTKRLNFSPNGKSLAVALPFACYQLSNPLDNLIMLYYILRTQELPTDVINIIIKLMSKVLEFEYCDFFEWLKI